MTEAVEMGIKSLEGRTANMHEAISTIEKRNAKTGQGMNNILDVVREMREKVQHLLSMQDHIDKQFKNVDRIIIGNTAADSSYTEYKAPEPIRRRQEPDPEPVSRTSRKISLSDDEEFVQRTTPTKVTFDELSDGEPEQEERVVASVIEPVECEVPSGVGGEDAEAKAAALEQAEKQDEEFEADEEALRREEEELARLEEEEILAKEAEEEEALKREEEELLRLEAEETELRRQEEEEALRKEEEELARMEAEEAELARLEEEEALRKEEEELKRLEEEEAKQAEEEEAKKKAEEEEAAKKKSKFPPPKKAPGGAANKFGPKAAAPKAGGAKGKFNFK